MKKLLIALVLGLVLVMALATVALADNGPHGSFSATTDACASCHRAHTAQGVEFLLVEGDIYQLCTGCHNGTGAYTDVVNGYYHSGGLQGDVDQCLYGGGFDFTKCTHTPNGRNGYFNAGPAAPEAVTSNHEVVTETTTGTVWGSGNIDSSLAGYVGGVLSGGHTLECTSCHSPHGKAGRDSAGSPKATYRLLNYNPTGSNGYEAITGPSLAYFTANAGTGIAVAGPTGGVQVDDVLAGKYWYTPNTDATIDPSVAAFYSRGVGYAYTGYINGLNDWAGRVYSYQRPAFQPNGTSTVCLNPATGLPDQTMDLTTCAYQGNPAIAAASVWDNATPAKKLGQWCALCHDRYLSQGGRSVDSGDTIYKYRHSSQNNTTCVVCHGAHGTSAVMTSTLAQNASLTATPTSFSSVLLKYDNRAICADCHGTGVGYYSDSIVYRK